MPPLTFAPCSSRRRAETLERQALQHRPRLASFRQRSCTLCTMMARSALFFSPTPSLLERVPGSGTLSRTSVGGSLFFQAGCIMAIFSE